MSEDRNYLEEKTLYSFLLAKSSCVQPPLHWGRLCRSCSATEERTIPLGRLSFAWVKQDSPYLPRLFLPLQQKFIIFLLLKARELCCECFLLCLGRGDADGNGSRASLPEVWYKRSCTCRNSYLRCIIGLKLQKQWEIISLLHAITLGRFVSKQRDFSTFFTVTIL